MRCIIFGGKGPNFTAGLDLNSAMTIAGAGSESDDPSRNGIKLYKFVESL